MCSASSTSMRSPGCIEPYGASPQVRARRVLHHRRRGRARPSRRASTGSRAGSSSSAGRRSPAPRGRSRRATMRSARSRNCGSMYVLPQVGRLEDVPVGVDGAVEGDGVGLVDRVLGGDGDASSRSPSSTCCHETVATVGGRPTFRTGARPVGEDARHGPHPVPRSRRRSRPRRSEFLAKLPPLNIFRMLAGGEGLLRAFSRFGNHLLYKTALDPVLREIAILRVGVLSDATYEMHQHDAHQPRHRHERGAARRRSAPAPTTRRSTTCSALVDALHRRRRAQRAGVGRHVRRPARGAVAAGAAGADGDDRLLHGRVAVPRDVRRRHRGAGTPHRSTCRGHERRRDPSWPTTGRADAAESAGTAPGRGRLAGRRILVVGAGQTTSASTTRRSATAGRSAILCAREGARGRRAPTAMPPRAEDTVATDRRPRAARRRRSPPTSPTRPASRRWSPAAAARARRPRRRRLQRRHRRRGQGLERATPEAWDRVIRRQRPRRHADGARRPAARSTDGASLVFISSVAGIKPGSRIPAYDASKAALGGLVRHVAVEGERRVDPGQHRRARG